MARNNIKILSTIDLKKLCNRYLFSLDEKEENVLVKTNECNRITSHPINKSFRINVVGERIIVFSVDAIEIWKELYKDNKKYSLILVQQCVNKLIMTFQQINKENVQKILSRRDIKIKKL